MKLNEYQQAAARTISPGLSCVEKIFHALHGMCSEVGELHVLYQKVYQGHPLDEEHAKKECGDILWFIAEYCTAQGWTLDEIARMNIRKLAARYPQGFEAERSIHREKGDV